MSKNNKIYLIITTFFSLFLLSMNLIGYLDFFSFSIIESSFLIFSLCFILSREANIQTSVSVDDDNIHFVFSHCDEIEDAIENNLINFKSFVIDKKRRINNLWKLFNCTNNLIIKNFLIKLLIFSKEKFDKIIFNFPTVLKSILPVRAGPCY